MPQSSKHARAQHCAWGAGERGAKRRQKCEGAARGRRRHFLCDRARPRCILSVTGTTLPQPRPKAVARAQGDAAEGAARAFSR